jgi:hypothetical protein
MKKEMFGTIMYDGKMINLDSTEIEKLEKISSDLKEKCESLKKKSEVIFKQ